MPYKKPWISWTLYHRLSGRMKGARNVAMFYKIVGRFCIVDNCKKEMSVDYRLNRKGARGTEARGHWTPLLSTSMTNHLCCFS